MRDLALDRHRVAVLPLKNISPDPKDEYFTDGMTEELISTLSKITNLRVIARTSVMKYKGETKSVAEIGAELGVGTVLEGSVRKAGSKLRITVQLIDPKSEEHLWSQQYDRELEDVFLIQSDIAKRIASALKIQIIQHERLEIEKKATKDLDAYTEYLNGRYQWNKRTEEGLIKAIDHFKRALEKDPAYALAYTGLADSYAMLALNESVPPEQVFPRAKAAAQKALQLDDKLAEAHTSLGLINFQYDRDWSGAESQFRRALEINTNYPPAHQFYADFLKAMGRLPEAIAQMKRAKELDPLSLSINNGMGHVLYLSRQYDEAIEQYRHAVEMDPNFVQGHLWFGRPYLQKGMYNEAIAEVLQAVKLSKESTISLAVLGHAYASAGNIKEAEEILEKLKERAKRQYVPSYWIALIYTGLGTKDEAFTWLERAFQERSSWLAWIKVEPRFDTLRSDPRFVSLLKRMRLETDVSASTNYREVISFLAGMSNLRLSRFRVVGNYTRYDESSRNLLKDLKQKIMTGLKTRSPKQENYLIWAPPGSGKTFFVQQAIKSMQDDARYFELNLAETDEESFRSILSEMDRSDKPSICFIDEIDSKPGEAWPYEALLNHLDAGSKRGTGKVFILAGSSGSSIEEMKKGISSRQKGIDLLTRIPHGNEQTIPSMSAEDRVLVALTNLKQSGRDSGKEISEVEKLALFYIAMNPLLSNARQLREFVLRSVERVPSSEDRVKYDNLFSPGDPQNKEFWIKARSETPDLINAFVQIDD
ncbi:MAG: tetratricopeptide repeat protein [Thaumarchaeota archaeon]|nr:tetratricopeptide repeat protein [Nitrososphaerota archaeon]